MINLNEVASGLSHHINLKKDEWWIAKFNKDEINFSEGRNLNSELEKYQLERLNDKLNGKHTVPEPEQEEYKENIITNIGMRESIDRDIGAVSTSLDWNSIGTSATAEAATDTDLVAEHATGGNYARKQFSVSGSRTRSTGTQTAIYAMLWTSSSLDSVPTTIRESGIHWHVSDASKLHARVTFSDFVLDTSDILVIRMTEQQANGAL